MRKLERIAEGSMRTKSMFLVGFLSLFATTQLAEAQTTTKKEPNFLPTTTPTMTLYCRWTPTVPLSWILTIPEAGPPSAFVYAMFQPGSAPAGKLGGRLGPGRCAWENEGHYSAFNQLVRLPISVQFSVKAIEIRAKPTE